MQGLFPVPHARGPYRDQLLRLACQAGTCMSESAAVVAPFLELGASGGRVLSDQALFLRSSGSPAAQHSA